jgi:hypothetical protein
MHTTLGLIPNATKRKKEGRKEGKEGRKESNRLSHGLLWTE